MAEQVHVLSLAEAEHVALCIRLRDEAKQRADAEFSQRMSVFHRQYNIAPGTSLAFESAIGPIPARLIYDTPDIPQPPAGSDAAEVSA